MKFKLTLDKQGNREALFVEYPTIQAARAAHESPLTRVLACIPLDNVQIVKVHETLPPLRVLRARVEHNLIEKSFNSGVAVSLLTGRKINL